MRLPGLERRHVVRRDHVEELLGPRPADLDPAQVRDVGQPRRRPHGLDLVRRALVLEGHLPSREVDELRPGRLMDGVERRSFER